MMASPALAQDAAVYPDPTLTPGAIRSTDRGEICSTDTRGSRANRPRTIGLDLLLLHESRHRIGCNSRSTISHPSKSEERMSLKICGRNREEVWLGEWE